MTSYKGSVKALAIVVVLLSIIIVSKLDNEQIEKEINTYQELHYEKALYSVATDQTAEEIDKIIPTITTNLKGLEQYKSAFIKAGQQFGIDYKLLISIAILESGWGTSRYAIENNNIFGWCSGQQKFNSVEECIYYVAEFLSREYLNPSGMYYEGTSIDGIAKHYNENPQKWAEEVKYIYERLGK